MSQLAKEEALQSSLDDAYAELDKIQLNLIQSKHRGMSQWWTGDPQEAIRKHNLAEETVTREEKEQFKIELSQASAN